MKMLIMRGHGTGEILFFLDVDGKPVSLDIYRYWKQANGLEYMPDLPLGWEGEFLE